MRLNFVQYETALFSCQSLTNGRSNISRLSGIAITKLTKNTATMKIEVIIEKSGNELWGRVEGKGDFLPTTVGHSTREVLQNLQELIADYLAHEGQEDSYWKKAIG